MIRIPQAGDAPSQLSADDKTKAAKIMVLYKFCTFSAIVGGIKIRAYHIPFPASEHRL
jgi:hypothetical protein